MIHQFVVGVWHIVLVDHARLQIGIVGKDKILFTTCFFDAGINCNVFKDHRVAWPEAVVGKQFVVGLFAYNFRDDVPTAVAAKHPALRQSIAGVFGLVGDRARLGRDAERRAVGISGGLGQD